MKKIQYMSDEEILNQLATAIHDYLVRIRPYGEFVMNDCMTMQINELKRLYRWSHGLTRGDALKRRDLHELEQLLTRLLPKMQENAGAVQLHYTKEQTLWKIRSTSAKAQIKAAFEGKGLKVTVDNQKYRAKVYVSLGGHTLWFNVPYKSLANEDTLPNVIAAVLDIKDAVIRIGGDVRLGK